MARILVIEDSPTDAAVLTQILERNGHQVMCSGSAEDGIETCKRELPDLVLMDMSLPVLDGWEATRRLKAAPATGHIPVIALTAHAMAGDRAHAMGAGCDDYDTKPIELPRLLPKIETLLAQNPGGTAPVSEAVP